MTKEREALKLALEALEDLGMKHYESTGEVLYKDTFTAIKEALAQPEQKPVALVYDPITGSITPPQRTWVGLTDDELQPIADEYRILFGSWVKDFAQAIEAKLKEKNT